MLSLELRQTLKQGLELTGGLTSQTVFPKTEEVLNDSDVQEALEFVGRKKRMEKYHSMMDFLFCESFPQWRFKAFSFYNGVSPALIDDDTITDEMILAYDVVMAEVVLPTCINLLKEKHNATWADLLSVVNNFLKVA